MQKGGDDRRPIKPPCAPNVPFCQNYSALSSK
jgi:hypothetical protein